MVCLNLQRSISIAIACKYPAFQIACYVSPTWETLCLLFLLFHFIATRSHATYRRVQPSHVLPTSAPSSSVPAHLSCLSKSKSKCKSKKHVSFHRQVDLSFQSTTTSPQSNEFPPFTSFSSRRKNNSTLKTIPIP